MVYTAQKKWKKKRKKERQTDREKGEGEKRINDGWPAFIWFLVSRWGCQVRCRSSIDLAWGPALLDAVWNFRRFRQIWSVLSRDFTTAIIAFPNNYPHNCHSVNVTYDQSNITQVYHLITSYNHTTNQIFQTWTMTSLIHLPRNLTSGSQLSVVTKQLSERLVGSTTRWVPTYL